MDEQRQNDQLEPIYNCSVSIQSIALKTNRERWTIEADGEKRVGELAARYDDNIYIYIYIYIYTRAS